jgi:UDPglucose 6-dehydrogenase
MRVSVIGLGKLGSPLAAVLASKGHYVIGVDVNPEFVRALASGKAPVAEPQLQELIDGARDRIAATTEYEDAVLRSDISFVIVPTPSDSSGAFSNKYVLGAVKEIGRALRKKQGYHVVNITSTVMPGSTGGEIRNVLEQYSGRVVGENVGLCYNPEFIALGSVVRDMLYPDMLLIGESDTRAGDVLEEIYRSTCANQPPVRRMNFVNAELTKISVNTFVTTKISYANMLADICDRLPDADVDVVTAAVGMDSRIGKKYLRGALGYGGPCFPRDNIAFARLARSLGARADVAEATDKLNGYQVERLVSVVRNRFRPGSTVGVLGLSYKPDTGVIEESQAVAFGRSLHDQGYRVVVHDPMATSGALAVLAGKAVGAESIEACVACSDVVVVTTAWQQFRDALPGIVRGLQRPLLIVDCWRVLDKSQFAGSHVEIVYLGFGNDHVGASSQQKTRLAAG